MRRILIMMATALGYLCNMAAYDLEADGLFYDLLPDGEAKVCPAPDGAKYGGQITIPMTVTDETGVYTVTCIESFSFADCVDLTEISLPESIRKIGERAFTSCISLEGITIPHGVHTIGERAFSGCTGLKQVTFECESASLGVGAFENATALPWLYLVGTPEIGDGAFANCTSLEWVEIEQGTDKIGGNAFANCTSIQTIYAHSEWPPMISINTFDNITELTAELKVISGAQGRYSMAAYWNRFGHISETSIFPVGIDEITESPFFVRGGKGKIFVNADSGNFAIYDTKGTRIAEFNAEEGKNGISVGSGVYMVADKTSLDCLKVIVR